MREPADEEKVGCELCGGKIFGDETFWEDIRDVDVGAVLARDRNAAKRDLIICVERNVIFWLIWFCNKK